MRNRVLLQLLIFLVFGRALAPAQGWGYSVECKDVALLAASGYPGPERSYTLRGSCTVFAIVVKTKDTGGFPFESKSENTLELKDQFIAIAVVSWKGKTGETREDMKIR
jgi:hypothetical protein